MAENTKDSKGSSGTSSYTDYLRERLNKAAQERKSGQSKQVTSAGGEKSGVKVTESKTTSSIPEDLGVSADEKRRKEIEERLYGSKSKKKDKGSKDKKKPEAEKVTEETQAGDVKSASWTETIKNDNRSARRVKEEVEVGNKKKKEGTVLKTLGIIFLSIVVAIGLVVGGYASVIQLSYSRIEDMRYLQVEAKRPERFAIGMDYTITTFDVGFGAFSQSYSYFLESSTSMGGVTNKGKSARAFNENDVINNINESMNFVKSKAEADMYLFQNVDQDSTRSYHVDEVSLIKSAIGSYSSVYASNAHSKYLMYPLNQPVGKVNSGILTLSKMNIDYSVRRTLPVSTKGNARFYDMDKCMIVTKMPVYGTNKYVVVINVQLSSYTDPAIREAQLQTILEYMTYEYKTNGNFVIVGGNFGVSLAGDYGVFNNDTRKASWVANLPDSVSADVLSASGFKINYDISTTNGTRRDASMKYSEGINLEAVTDGFITSENVSVTVCETIDGDFKNSNHNPVRMKFSLIGA